MKTIMIKILKAFMLLYNKTLTPIITFYYTIKIKLMAESVGKGLLVKRSSSVSKTTCLGDNVNFNGMTIIGLGRIKIGNNFHSGKNCCIISSYHNYDNGSSIPYDNTFIHKNVTIEDNVWLGNNVTILGGVTIGEGAIIQIGSVVVKSIPKYGIAGGNPAIVYKYRDKEHYEKLKNKKSFH